MGPGDTAADRLNIFNTSNSLQVGSMFTSDLSFSGGSLESSSIVLLSLASRSFPIKSWRLSQGPGWIVIMIIDCNDEQIFLQVENMLVVETLLLLEPSDENSFFLHVRLHFLYILIGKGSIEKNDFFLGKSPKLWVGGGQES